VDASLGFGCRWMGMRAQHHQHDSSGEGKGGGVLPSGPGLENLFEPRVLVASFDWGQS
jgi:hypothetical protein